MSKEIFDAIMAKIEETLKRHSHGYDRFVIEQAAMKIAEAIPKQEKCDCSRPDCWTRGHNHCRSKFLKNLRGKK